jgi:hypothetical protein
MVYSESCLRPTGVDAIMAGVGDRPGGFAGSLDLPICVVIPSIISCKCARLAQSRWLLTSHSRESEHEADRGDGRWWVLHGA